MDYLARESADLSVELWNRIDDAVVGTARKHLTCRRFLKTHGPLGVGTTTVAVDSVAKEEVLEDGIGRIVGRTQLELPLFYEDFTLLGRDLDLAARSGMPVDLAPAIAAAKRAARREDNLVLNGNAALGVEGLLNVKGAGTIKRRDWSKGENGFADVAAAVSQLAKTGYLGRYALAVAPDLYLGLQRLQPNTGMLEIDRVQKLIGDNVFMTSVIAPGQAVLVCAEPEYLDLALGLDLSVGLPGVRRFQPHVPRHGNDRPAREGPRCHRRVRVTRVARLKFARDTPESPCNHPAIEKSRLCAGSFRFTSPQHRDGIALTAGKQLKPSLFDFFIIALLMACDQSAPDHVDAQDKRAEITQKAEQGNLEQLRLHVRLGDEAGAYEETCRDKRERHGAAHRVQCRYEILRHVEIGSHLHVPAIDHIERMRKLGGQARRGLGRCGRCHEHIFRLGYRMIERERLLLHVIRDDVHDARLRGNIHQHAFDGHRASG